MTNTRGDVIGIYNTTGTRLAKYEYDAWGNVISITHQNGNAITSASNIANVNPIRYRGYYYDAEIGMYYLQSRYYDSQIGRFINADDSAFLGASGTVLSYNLFAYCNNNPVIHIDIDGKISINIICISFVNIIKKLLRRNDNLGQRIKNRYGTSKFGKSPLTVKISGNTINISVKFKFVGSLKDMRFGNKSYNKTYKRLFLDAIEQYWSGTFNVYGYNVKLLTTVKESNNSGISVHMLDSYGVSHASFLNGWRTGDYGYIVIYRGDSRSDKPSNYEANGIKYVAAHEFGHILGVYDIYNTKYKDDVYSVFNAFGSRVQDCDVEMVLMAFLFNCSITYEYYLNKRSQVI